MSLLKKRSILPLATLLLVTACSKEQSTQNTQASRPPPQVNVVVVHQQSVPVTRDIVGRLAATRIAEVRARVTGIVLKRTYTEGTYVKQGQQLFQIDPAPLQASLHVQEAALAQAQASAANAARIAKRYEGLNKKGLISPQDLDNALSTERTTAAAVKQAEANVELARLNLSYASVTAPISGQVETAMVTEGALVSQSSATQMTTIEQIDPIYVNFSLPSADLRILDQSRKMTGNSQTDIGKVSLAFPDGTAYPKQGVVNYLDLAVNPDTGTVSLRGTVPNPDRQLLPGMFMNVHFTVGAVQNAFLLPQAAVLRDGHGAYILTVGNDGKVAQVRVNTHTLEGSAWVITSQALHDGDKVIVSGLQKVHPGGEAKATVVKGSQDGASEPASSESQS